MSNPRKNCQASIHFTTILPMYFQETVRTPSRDEIVHIHLLKHNFSRSAVPETPSKPFNVQLGSESANKSSLPRKIYVHAIGRHVCRAKLGKKDWHPAQTTVPPPKKNIIPSCKTVHFLGALLRSQNIQEMKRRLVYQYYQYDKAPIQRHLQYPAQHNTTQASVGVLHVLCAVHESLYSQSKNTAVVPAFLFTCIDILLFTPCPRHTYRTWYIYIYISSVHAIPCLRRHHHVRVSKIYVRFTHPTYM